MRSEEARGVLLDHHHLVSGRLKPLAVGARLLCNSLNSFARDEASLHVPVRAAENGVWVAAANKVGSLLPAGRAAEFSEALGVPAEALQGAGESQIVDPDGTVVVKAPPTGEAVVAADIDLSRCRPQRLDGRRPRVYGPLARPDTAIPAPARCACGPPPTTGCWSGPCIPGEPPTGKCPRTSTWWAAGPWPRPPSWPVGASGPVATSRQEPGPTGR